MLGDLPAAERCDGERATVLASYSGRWSRIRRQAERILRECGAGLRGDRVRLSDAEQVTLELMGARRAFDGVPEADVRPAPPAAIRRPVWAEPRTD